MNNEHLLTCVYLNKGQLHNLDMENIRNGNIIEKIEALKKLQENSEQRIKYIKSTTQGI